MSSNSKFLFDRAKEVIPSGVNSPVRFYQPYPFFVASSKDSKIVTVDHKTCIDYCMGYGSLLLGHAYTAVLESVKSQIDKGTLFCVPTEREVKLAELISKVVPCAEMTRLVNTGAEATMNATRLARAFTKKKKIIKFEGCYHGAYDYVLVGSADSTGVGIPNSEGTIEEVSSQTLVVPYNNYSELEQVINKHDNIACIIIEPVPANIGLIIPDKQYLNEIRKMTQKQDIVLIFDEVITGFRLALGGASEFFGIKPDLATFAKAMGNGFPIAAIAGKKQIMEQFSPSGKVYQASTYAGNPLSVSASIATIETLIETKNEVYPGIARTCDRIVEGINNGLEQLKLHFTINAIGSMYQLFFTSGNVDDDKSAKKSDVVIFKKFHNELLKRGIFIPPSQFETCFISNAHSEDDADKTIECIPKRAKPNDVLVNEKKIKLRDLPTGSLIGTSSLRRAIQVMRKRSDLNIKPIRGNVETRVNKTTTGEFDAVVLAEAGLTRLDMRGVIAERFSIKDFLPSPGQGAIAIVCRSDDLELIKILRSVEDPSSRAEIDAERSLLTKIQGGCRFPVGTCAITRYDTSKITLYATVFSADGTESIKVKETGSKRDPNKLGVKVANLLFKAGVMKLAEGWRDAVRA